MNIAAYFRVSTPGQDQEDTYGLERQRAEVAAYCHEHGHTVVASYEDVASGASPDRDGLLALLREEGIEAVVVAAWDRLARDAYLDGWIRHTLHKRAVTVLSATQANGIDPASKMMQGLLTLVAEYERHMIQARTAGGKRIKSTVIPDAYIHGQPPYGAKATLGSGVLRQNPEEVVQLVRIKEMKRRGHTLQAIARILNAEGVPTRRGGQWRHQAVGNALRTADMVLRLSA